jgi:putative addiction module CopG family antidote
LTAKADGSGGPNCEIAMLSYSEKMNVVLPQQLELAVKKKIASGKYRSAEELVTEAVSRLIEQESAAPRDLSWLEKELQAGLDSPAREITEADWQQLRQRTERKANAS